MIRRLVLAEMRNRPGRAALLLGGYALGVAVMVVLLAVGEAMLTQARDRALLGGGDVIIVPAGITPEMLKAGGTNALFLGLEQARFIHRQILESPRGREELGISASSPILDGRLVRISHQGRAVQAIASAEIPSRAEAAGAAPRLLSGRWSDSRADRQWAEPSPEELYHEIDAFHLPYGSAVGDSTWAEWHYFNVVLDEDRWIYLTYMVGGRIGTPGEWGGRLLVTLRDADGTHRSISRDFEESAVRFDTTSADVTFEGGGSVVQRDGAYRLLGSADGVELDLTIRPRPHRIFPPSDLGGNGLVSGYVVPALAATAEGRVCLPDGEARACETVSAAPAYHDHNWGVWRDVSWEWGAASGESLSLLFGAVHTSESRDQGLFAYLVDDRGVRGVYRASSIGKVGGVFVDVGGARVEVPSRLTFTDSRRGIEVEIDIEDRQVTDLERVGARYFVQMRGTALVRLPGSPPQRLSGFFETYVDDTGRL